MHYYQEQSDPALIRAESMLAIDGGRDRFHYSIRAIDTSASGDKATNKKCYLFTLYYSRQSARASKLGFLKSYYPVAPMRLIVYSLSFAKENCCLPNQVQCFGELSSILPLRTKVVRWFLKNISLGGLLHLSYHKICQVVADISIVI